MLLPVCSPSRYSPVMSTDPGKRPPLVDPSAAVELAAGMAREAVAFRPGAAAVFAAAGDLRRATAALAAALQDEAGADARALLTEQHFRAASGQLGGAAERARKACASAPDDPARAAAAAVLEAGLKAWRDPYAGDAAGVAERQAWTRALDALPNSLELVLAPVRQAMARAGARGRAWDDALKARAAAISRRDEASRSWQAALAALVCAAGDGPWLDPARRAGPGASSEDDWFAVEE